MGEAGSAQNFGKKSKDRHNLGFLKLICIQKFFGLCYIFTLLHIITPNSKYMCKNIHFDKYSCNVYSFKLPVNNSFLISSLPPSIIQAIFGCSITWFGIFHQFNLLKLANPSFWLSASYLFRIFIGISLFSAISSLKSVWWILQGALFQHYFASKIDE